jgi:plasmid replication initiation protein
MSADPLRDLFARSALVRASVRVARSFDAAARSSMLAGLVARGRRELGVLTPADRVRLAGLLVLTALATEQVLIRLIPASLRPAPPSALRYLIGLTAAATIAAAPQLVRAWPTSRLRSMCGRSDRPWSAPEDGASSVPTVGLTPRR